MFVWKALFYFEGRVTEVIIGVWFCKRHRADEGGGEIELGELIHSIKSIADRVVVFSIEMKRMKRNFNKEEARWLVPDGDGWGVIWFFPIETIQSGSSRIEHFRSWKKSEMLDFIIN